MAWALKFDGVNDSAIASSGVAIASSDDFSIKFKFPADANSGNHRVLGGTVLGSSAPRIILFSGGNAVLYGSSGGNKAFTVSIDTSVDREVEFRRVSGQLGLYYDNAIQGSTQASTQTFANFQVIGGNFGSVTIASQLEYLQIDVAGSPIVDWNSTASSHGSGNPVLVDLVGSNDATGVNMPTDGSAWVDLGGGGVTVTPSNINSVSVSSNPVIAFNSIVNVSPSSVNSTSTALNPLVSLSSTINITPNAVDSVSTTNNPIIDFSSLLQVTPLSIDSSSIANNPVVSFTSSLMISPSAIGSLSSSLDPLIEFKSIINLTPNSIDSLSTDNNPFITTGAVQTIGNVTSSFAIDAYSVKYKQSTITVNFK